MENLESRLRSRGESLHASPTARLKLPTGSQVRNGVFEDLGSGFGRVGSKKLDRKSSQPRKPEPGLASDSDLGSDDEMDCLSQISQADEKTVIDQRRSRSEYDSEVVAEKSRRMKGLKFNKTKSNVEVKLGKAQQRVASNAPSPSRAKAKTKTPRYRSDVENDSDGYQGTRKNTVKPKASSSQLDTVEATRPKPRPKLRPVKRPPAEAENDISICLGTSTKKPITQKPSEFPFPSPLSKPAAGNSKRNSPSSNLGSSSSSNATSISSTSHSPPPSSSYSSMLASSKSAPRLPQAFPTFSPLNSPDGRHSNATVTESFPTISPLSKYRVVTRFPDLSPFSKDAPKVAQKNKRRGKSKRKAGALAPFPMSTQDFGGTNSSSEGESDSDKHHAQRRRLQIVDETSAMVDDMDLYEEDDSFFMSPGVDPKTLCPYCDSPLPPSPTRFFLNLLQSALRNSYPDPRSTNPLGRKAPLSTFVAVCQRHDFESEVLPEAEAKGWPKTIDWEELGDRVANMKQDLEHIIQDSGEADIHALIEDEKTGEGNLVTSFACKGPRVQCVFWREAMETAIRRGKRAMSDVRGQFLDFENSQPGYYGELGQIIIQQTLFNMFPLNSFDPNLIKPFTPNDFTQRILVPEVALRLIMEDRGLKGLVGTEEALQILRDSTTYGVTMFPEDSGEGTSGSGGKRSGKAGTFGVGDRIVMERARKRRKEIEEGGEIDALFEDGGGNGSENEIAAERKREERKGKRRGREDREDEEDIGDTPALTGLEPEPPRKASRKERKKPVADDDDSAISIDLKSDGNNSEMSAQTDTSIPRSRPRRNRKVVDYNDYSNDQGKVVDTQKSRTRRTERSPSKPRSKRPSQYQTQVQRRSLSANEWTPTGSQTEQEGDVGSKFRPLNISDMEICSSDDNSGLSKLRPSKELERLPSKQSGYTSDRVVGLDLNTPIPKRCAVVGGGTGEDEPTPKPPTRKSITTAPVSQPPHTVLALARARKQTAETDGHAQTSKSTKQKMKTSKAEQWLNDIRSCMPKNGSGSDSDSHSAVDAVEEQPDHTGMRRGTSNSKGYRGTGKGMGELKRQESFSWLLDEPSSQEFNGGKPSRI